MGKELRDFEVLDPIDDEPRLFEEPLFEESHFFNPFKGVFNVWQGKLPATGYVWLFATGSPNVLRTGN